MTHMGYGVTCNGKPAGVWPVPYEYAEKSLKKYKAADIHHLQDYQIVSVYVDLAPALNYPYKPKVA